MTQNFYVVEHLKVNLLGLPTITAFNLFAIVDAVETATKADMQKPLPSLFQGLGNLGDDYQARRATPHSIYTPRHVPLPLHPKVQEELNRMEWCVGMVVVPKKGGNVRICVDL